MAEVLASLKKIGGNGEQYTETSLWLNPNQSPTSSTTFAAQTVALSDNIRNYKYIAIRFFGDTGLSNRVIYNVSDYVTFRLDGNTTHNIGALQFQASNNYTYARLFYYVDDTHVGFTLDFGVNRAVNYQTSNIPLEILGINELAYKPDDYIVQSGTYSIASTNTPVTVTVGFKPKKLTTWRIGGTTTFESFTYDDRISETTYDRLMVFSGGTNGATRTIGQSQTNELVSINNDGFTVATGGVTGTWNYIAVGLKE